jgi:hypothetical protein
VQHYAECHFYHCYVERHYAECHIFIVMLIVAILLSHVYSYADCRDATIADFVESFSDKEKKVL